jgi:hypothetical protein
MSQVDIPALRFLSATLAGARVLSVRVARTEDGDVHSFFLELDDGRILYLGEYGDIDPPRIISLADDAHFERAEMDGDLLQVAGRVIQGIFLDGLRRVILGLEGDMLLWAHFGEAEMFLEVDIEPELRRGWLATLTAL